MSTCLLRKKKKKKKKKSKLSNLLAKTNQNSREKKYIILKYRMTFMGVVVKVSMNLALLKLLINLILSLKFYDVTKTWVSLRARFLG